MKKRDSRLRREELWESPPILESLRALPLLSARHYALMSPDLCPHCGAEVPEKARVCPECGSDAETGWSEKAKYDNLGIDYEDSFNYEEFVKQEFERKSERPRISIGWIIAGIVLIATFLFLWLR